MENFPTRSIDRILVCQNRTCRSQGSAAVLATLRDHPVAGVAIEGCGCLGQCGSGPMVLVLPQEVWYSGVHPAEIPAVVEQHLLGLQPVKAMLYRKFHH